MRKLTDDEERALKALAKYTAYCPGADSSRDDARLRKALHGLVRKRYAVAEETDDGTKFTLTAAGRDEAAFLERNAA